MVAAFPSFLFFLACLACLTERNLGVVAVNSRLFVRLTSFSLLSLACSSTAPVPVEGAAAASSPPERGGNRVAGPSVAETMTAPGLYLVDPATAGGGACAPTTLADVLDAIRAGDPALVGVNAIYNPAQSGGDGNLIYPYRTSDGGFAVAFKRGAGDCPAGCTDNTYDYFRTDAACVPRTVGHYHEVSGACLMVDGQPMWGHPPALPDPAIVCGADNTPQDISGHLQFHATGQAIPCAVSGDKGLANDVDTTLDVTVMQDPANLGTGVVIVSGTGNPLVDGIALPATFIRRRFEATLQKSNLPSNCPQESAITARYDFESGRPGTLTAHQTGDDNCSMCKGGLLLTLSID